MKLFGRKKDRKIPLVQNDKYELVLRCSICNGEQVLCSRDKETGSLNELMLIHSFSELQEVCEANHIAPASVRKIY